VDRHADHAIITSDNPRKENPDTIIAEIEKGFRSTHYEKIVDRLRPLIAPLNCTAARHCF